MTYNILYSIRVLRITDHRTAEMIEAKGYRTQLIGSFHVHYHSRYSLSFDFAQNKAAVQFINKWQKREKRAIMNYW